MGPLSPVLAHWLVALVGGQEEAVFLPEATHRFPELVGRAVDHDPAGVAGAFHADVAQPGRALTWPAAREEAANQVGGLYGEHSALARSQ